MHREHRDNGRGCHDTTGAAKWAHDFVLRISGLCEVMPEPTTTTASEQCAREHPGIMNVNDVEQLTVARYDGAFEAVNMFFGGRAVGLKAASLTYLNSWWLAPLIVLVALLTFTVAALGHPLVPALIVEFLFLTLAAAVLGALVAGIGNLVRKRWRRALLQLAIIPLTGTSLFLVVAAMSMAAFFGPSEDQFADDLVIPDDIEVTEMKPVHASATGVDGEDAASGADAFQTDLLVALKQPGGSDPTVTASVDAIVQLHNQTPDVLNRYLAASPAWRVFMKDGNRYATRRWKLNGRWRYNLGGYYTDHDLERWDRSLPRFQSRLTLGFSGEPSYSRRSGDTQVQPGQTRPLTLTTGNQMPESRLVIDASDDLVVEVFEQSPASERRLTKATLDHLENELMPLKADPRWETIQQMLPTGSIQSGQPSIELRESFQPGIYDGWIWLNPGEPGMIYLKAFEVTQGTRLSVGRLQERSNEWVGWTDDADALFLSNTHFTIYEGDWGKPYAARFEVWFVPDDGGPERKLLEKVFKIEGWQR
ncbi:MAG: hypothetical protein WD294_01565 [Phycisphaeraceae bacterium]